MEWNKLFACCKILRSRIESNKTTLHDADKVSSSASTIIEIQLNYINCDATFAGRGGREIYECCSSQSAREIGGKKRGDLWLMFAVRKRGGSRLFAVCLRYSYAILHHYSPMQLT